MVTGVPVTRYGARLTRTPNLWFGEAIDDIVEIIYSTERVSLLLLFLFGLTSEMLHLLRDTYLMDGRLIFHLICGLTINENKNVWFLGFFLC